MATELKSKESLRTQLGKGCELFQAAALTKGLAMIGPELLSIGIWDDGLPSEGAAYWVNLYNQVLADDCADKPDGKHCSLDITVGTNTQYEAYLILPSPMNAKYKNISLWWKGANTGLSVGIAFYNPPGYTENAMVFWIDNSVNWQLVKIPKSNFASTPHFDWSNIQLIDFANLHASSFPQGVTVKVAYVTSSS